MTVPTTDHEMRELIAEAAMSEFRLPGLVTPTAYILPEELTLEQYLTIGVALKKMGESYLIWLGDFLIFGERKFSEVFAQVIEETGYDKHTLQNAMWVAEHVDHSRRREELKFGHYDAVAALGPAEQSEWLDRAVCDNLSVHRLRQELRESGARNPKAQPDWTAPAEDAPNLVQCPSCGGSGWVEAGK